METLKDWAYLMERTFPQLHGAGSFFLGALFVLAICLGLYFITRSRTHLLTSLSIVLYLLPFTK